MSPIKRLPMPDGPIGKKVCAYTFSPVYGMEKTTLAGHGSVTVVVCRARFLRDERGRLGGAILSEPLHCQARISRGLHLPSGDGRAGSNTHSEERNTLQMFLRAHECESSSEEFASCAMIGLGFDPGNGQGSAKSDDSFENERFPLLTRFAV
ncbi:hypothetical protein AXG93_2145s1790 [Marchantia polymorpha subsp. ruderalis]|uniref:Uncharacterized protein n=1 Tax=Marchantia polymorpha subsp. ruderalis TaxID=1480154 RepID=A0A176VYJ4_MARPO|nr:hypothetical protein AXG93_2145s1790 [Marchantia polymorpha subsp. ruderalis]